MKISEIMTRGPACCSPESNLQLAARLMRDHDCGEIPVVKSDQDLELIGVLTDRDIAIRAVAEGKNPQEMKVEQCMSRDVCTVTEDAEVGVCEELMEKRKIRRIPIVDSENKVIGIISQADIARHCPKDESAEVVQKVSV